MTSHTSPLRVRGDVVSRTMGDGAVLVDLRTNEIFELNATGARVWELVSETQPLTAVVDTVVREFDVTRAVAETDVADLVGELVERGLLVSAAGA